MHVFKDDDRVLARISQKKVTEVRRAHGQDEFVRREVVLAAGQGHVDELKVGHNLRTKNNIG